MNTSTLLPWGTTIAPVSDDIDCPSPSRILGTFAIINTIVTSLSCIFGNRRILNWATGRRLFKNADSKTHRFTWIIAVGLQLSANALVGYIFRRSPGYRTDLQIWQLMLLFTVRPRLSWIGLLILGMCGSPRKLRDTPLDESSKNLLDPGNESKSGSGSSKEYPWSSAAKSQAYAELALQVMASFVLGRVVHFGVRNGFYIIGSATYKELPPAARLMYGGALFYLITASMMVLVEILFIIGSYSDNSSERREMWKPGALLFIFGNLATTWLASWLFWTGFVKLAKADNLYCAPKLSAQGLIWGLFSLIGITIGAGG